MKTTTFNENSQERHVLLVWFVRSKMKLEREEEAQDRKTSNSAPISRLCTPVPRQGSWLDHTNPSHTPGDSAITSHGEQTAVEDRKRTASLSWNRVFSSLL